MTNKKCLNCNNEFVSNDCCLIHGYESFYCSSSCFYNSSEYKNIQNLVEIILNKLDKNIINELHAVVWNNDYFYNELEKQLHERTKIG